MSGNSVTLSLYLWCAFLGWDRLKLEKKQLSYWIWDGRLRDLQRRTFSLTIQSHWQILLMYYDQQNRIGQIGVLFVEMNCEHSTCWGRGPGQMDDGRRSLEGLT